jgi:hypothetical protein
MLSEKEIEQRRKAAESNITHGMYAFRDSGESTLAPAQRSRYVELKELFESEPGRVEYRKELATHIAMMLELGFSHVRSIAEKGGNIWTAPPIKNMGVYVNALIRLMNSWPKDQGAQVDVSEIVSKVVEEHERKDT